MGWKATGTPTVRKQRDRFVVRVDGIDTETGRHRPRQLGTYGTQRAARNAAREALEGGLATSERGTLAWLVRRYVASRTDVSLKAREQYQWAAGHVEAGLGAVRLDKLDRQDVACWLESLAREGALSRRSIQVCRTVLRAALADAVDEGLIGRSPAARVAMPRDVAKPPKEKATPAWTDEQVERFLTVAGEHRWSVGFRLAVLYGLRRSELLALTWADLDTEAGRLRIDKGFVAVQKGAVWTDAKNARSRRTIPLDRDTVAAFGHHRRIQAEERLLAGPAWTDHDLVLATHTGDAVQPRSFDRTLLVVVKRAGLPNLTSHGLRHTAATHMVRRAADLGELRAVADILGHSPEILLTVYAHALPDTVRTVADRIGSRNA